VKLSDQRLLNWEVYCQCIMSVLSKIVHC